MGNPLQSYRASPAILDVCYPTPVGESATP